MVEIIIAGVLGFLIGGFFGTMTMALMVGCRKENDDNEI